jgi:very-short-patch-repair endonuclease
MKVQQARHLRRNATAAEKRLWSRLNNRQTAGLKFRRQHPIANRIVDFFCAEAKLAIELDGSGHARHTNAETDLDRELDLHAKGIRVLRFRNRDIFNNLSGVFNAMIYAVDPEKSLWPSQQPGGMPKRHKMIGPHWRFASDGLPTPIPNAPASYVSPSGREEW